MPMPKKIPLTLLVSIALLASGAAARAQKGGGATVLIKAKPSPANLPTLLVMCDLACNWKLDGDAKGHIDAGKGVKMKVEPGQHMVEVTSEDGMDQVMQPCTVKPTGQTMVYIELWPIRYARFVAEYDAQDEAAQAQAAREQAERDAQAAREQAKRDAPFNAQHQAVALYNQKRYREALTLFQHACDAGLAQACGYQGFMYARGQGVARDYSRSLLLYSKACDAGSGPDCTNLGQFYALGKGVHKDKKKAKLLYLKGCSMGDETGCKWANKIHLH